MSYLLDGVLHTKGSSIIKDLPYLVQFSEHGSNYAAVDEHGNVWYIKIRLESSDIIHSPILDIEKVDGLQNITQVYLIQEKFLSTIDRNMKVTDTSISASFQVKHQTKYDIPDIVKTCGTVLLDNFGVVYKRSACSKKFTKIEELPPIKDIIVTSRLLKMLALDYDGNIWSYSDNISCMQIMKDLPKIHAMGEELIYDVNGTMWEYAPIRGFSPVTSFPNATQIAKYSDQLFIIDNSRQLIIGKLINKIVTFAPPIPADLLTNQAIKCKNNTKSARKV
jgi:hypothetical protein